MANEFKISEIVDEEAIEQVQRLKSELVALKEEYTGLALKLANKLTVNAASFTELAKEGKDVNGILAQIADTEGKMAETSKQINIINVQMAKNISEVRKQLQEENKIAQSNEKTKQATLNTAKAESALATQIARQKKTEAAANKDVAVTAEQAEAAYKKEVKTIKEAQEANKILRAYVKTLDTTDKEAAKTIEEYNKKIKDNTRLITDNSDAIVKNKMNVGNYEESIRKAIQSIRENGASKDNILRLVFGIGQGVSAQVPAAIGSITKMVVSLGSLAGAMSVFGTIKEATRTIIGFEKANSNLAAILGTNIDGISELTKQARQLGASTSFTASQVTELQTELAKLGFTTIEIQQSTADILKFAKATGSDLASAASVAGAALRMFGADADDMDRYVSVMAVSTTKSALSFSDLQSSLATVGPVANAFGFTIEDTVTLLGKLKDSGFDASSAATATRNIFLNLADANGKLAKSLGSPVRNMDELAAGLLKLRERGVSLAEALDMTDKRSVAAFESFLNVADSLVPLRESVTDVTGELDDMASTMGNNVAGAITTLGSAWEGLMLTFSNSKGTMMSVVNFLTGAVKGIQYLFSDAVEQQDQKNQEMIGQANKALEGSNGILAKQTERIKGIYEERVAAGEDAAKADDALRAEELARLKTDGDKQKSVLEGLYKEMEALQEKHGKKDGVFAGIFKGMASGGYLGKMKELENQIALVNAEIEKNAQLQRNVEKIELNKNQTPDVTNNNYTSDKIKKQLEKEAKEREKIQQALNDSIVDLMEDGLEKELAKIRSSYEKKMAQYKGNSESEKQLRLNLSLKMTEEIEKKTLLYQLSETEKSINLRKESIVKGTSEYLSAEIQLLQVNYRKKTELENVSAQERLALFEKYERDYTELVTEFEEKRKNEHLESISNSVSMTATLMNARMEAELNALKQLYSNGEITENEYNKTVAEMKIKYAKNSAEETVKYLEDVLKSEALTDEEREDLELKLAKARMALSDAVANNEIQNNKNILESQKKAIHGAMDIVEYVADAVDGVTELGNRLYQNQLDKLKEQQDEINAAYDEEEERINELEENGSITTEEAEARKRAAKDRTQKKNEEIARKQEEIEKKQARLAKATAIAQAIMSTALAVMRVYADPGNGGFISRGIMAGVVSALGAMQLATIVATPLAAYKEGTNDHKGGMAIVGDGGRPEVISYNGKAWITPGVPTLVNMPKHAQVFPDIASFEAMKPMISSDYLSLSKSHGEVKVVNDFTSLQKSVENGNYRQEKLLAKILKANKTGAFELYINSRM